MKHTLLQQCILLLRRDDIKSEIKEILRPIIDILLQEIYPYIYLSLIFVLINFLLTLGIFIILFRNKYIVSKLI
jgi:hypothetical protein